MPRRHQILPALVFAIAMVPSAAALAQTCRARAIVENQCTWLVLDELGGDRRAAKRAEHAATAELTPGCTQGEYQMVLLRGTGVTQSVAERMRGRGRPDAAGVRAACAAAAGAAAQ